MAQVCAHLNVAAASYDMSLNQRNRTVQVTRWLSTHQQMDTIVVMRLLR